jgi:hypothetical protein
MRCIVCKHGETELGQVTVSVERCGTLSDEPDRVP